MTKTRRSRKAGWISVLSAAGLLSLLAVQLPAQGIYATLTGVVSDPSTAVVAKAKVTLTDAQSGSQPKPSRIMMAISPLLPFRLEPTT
jgi:hypothetical protein